MKRDITAVIGGQFGSEGKGSLVAHLAHAYSHHVRVGGPNAGHTIHHEGRTWKMQSVPCGWINSDAELYLGAGAVIDFEHLAHEIQELEAAGYKIRERLTIDLNATPILQYHKALEGGVGGTAHRLIGSTGEGVGLARMARINRKALLPHTAFDSVLPVQFLNEDRSGLAETFKDVRFVDTVRELNEELDVGASVLLEGTQGSGLSLTHGPWPYTTSHDTNVSQLLADVGLPPVDVQTILVVRAFPIRVAGQSGPLPNEVTWEELGQDPERTTVTHKVRRIARFSFAQARHAVMLNAPASICATFLDYINPNARFAECRDDLPKPCREFVDELETGLGVPVQWGGVGPHHIINL